MKVFWVGSKCFRWFAARQYYVEVMGLDAIAKSYMALNNIPFIDLSGMMRKLLPLGANYTNFSADTLHWGAVSYSLRQGSRITISSMLMQVIMGVLCR